MKSIRSLMSARRWLISGICVFVAVAATQWLTSAVGVPANHGGAALMAIQVLCIMAIDRCLEGLLELAGLLSRD